MYSHVLLFLFAITCSTSPGSDGTSDYPSSLCWVMVENAALVLPNGERVPLELGEQLFISEIEESRLFVARTRIGQLRAEGWIDKDRVGSAFEIVPQLDPEYTGRALGGFRPYLAIAQARYAVTHTPGVITTGQAWKRIDECLDAAEKLAPSNTEVLWERAMLPRHKPASERVRLLDSLILREPSNALVFFWRAKAKEEGGDRAGAISDLRRALALFGQRDKRYGNDAHLVAQAQESLSKLVGDDD